MASNCIAQASSETNVEFKSYIFFDRALHEARGIYESFASIAENRTCPTKGGLERLPKRYDKAA